MTEPWRAMPMALLLAGCAGCSAAGSGSEPWCSNHRCDYAALSFAPEMSLLETTQSALKNLNGVSGLGLDIDPEFGIPVRLVPETVYDGKPLCGFTNIVTLNGYVLSIEVEVSASPPDGCSPQWGIIRHEIACHALNPLKLGDVDYEGHTKRGMCSPWGDTGVAVDAESLAVMCAGVGGCF